MDHRTLCTSATSTSPDGARVAEPLVAAVKVRETLRAAASVEAAASAEAEADAGSSMAAAAAVAAAAWKSLRRERSLVTSGVSGSGRGCGGVWRAGGGGTGRRTSTALFPYGACRTYLN